MAVTPKLHARVGGPRHADHMAEQLWLSVSRRYDNDKMRASRPPSRRSIIRCAAATPSHHSVANHDNYERPTSSHGGPLSHWNTLRNWKVMRRSKRMINHRQPSAFPQNQFDKENRRIIHRAPLSLALFFLSRR